MKKIVLSLAAITTLSMVVSVATNDGQLHSNSSGAPSAGACTACHGGAVNTSNLVELVVTDTQTEEVVTSYIAGRTYFVAAGMFSQGTEKMGFALSASAGTLALDPDVDGAQIRNGYATHTSNGTATVAGVGAWGLLWTAPASGTVNFQLYINASNNDNGDNGDMIYGKSLSLPSGANSVRELNAASFHVFPNPATAQLQVQMIKQGASASVVLTSIDGKISKQLYNGTVLGNLEFDVTELPAGIYFMQVTTNGNSSIQKVLIQ
ncbi:MAG: T9SS type A sorting domain-containing protein [Bacteroidia bacterium]|nr:T9SS type A sorting domain-containing protein [Bacteroidia bacterium]